jgi:Uma2 family endonuclease
MLPIGGLVMARPRPTDPLDFEGYLALEGASDQKHEYLRGQAYAMVGASLRHGRITLNLARRLDEATEAGPCRVYASDAKVRVEAADACFYPDVVVSCDARDAGPHVLLSPVLVVEVLSPSTAGFDRGQKFSIYRQLESLEEYVVVETDRQAVDVFRRGQAGTWVLTSYQEGDSIELQSLGATVPMDLIYDRLPPE